MIADLPRRAAAEFFGALTLAGVVVGSGVMAERLSPDDPAMTLFANSAATGAILFVLITALSPISGAHLNPVVSLVMAVRRELSWASMLSYCAAQIGGCLSGVTLAHAMFELPLIQQSAHVRAGSAQVLSEAVATFALIACILLVSRARPNALAAAVAMIVSAGYWWTASTSFANPAITIARAFTDSFSGIRLLDVPGFVLAQIFGALIALAACAWLYRTRAAQAVSTAAATRSVSNNGG